jgi:hypothetical protein
MPGIPTYGADGLRKRNHSLETLLYMESRKTDPLIEESPVLRNLVQSRRSRDSGNLPSFVGVKSASSRYPKYFPLHVHKHSILWANELDDTARVTLSVVWRIGGIWPCHSLERQKFF